jgi:hypothetical protein
VSHEEVVPRVSLSLAARLRALLRDDGRPGEEREGLIRLMLVLAGLPPPPDPDGVFRDYPRLHERFLAAADLGDGERLEEAFLELYCHLHLHEAPYTPQERKRLNETGGYWCHAGGLSPILKAGPWIRPETVSADFGAGNGLQGLLLQVLYPHARTRQIEISTQSVEIGKRLQTWLGVPAERVEWVAGDLLEASALGVDFLYLYRPLRPQGEGRRFYERLASELEQAPGPVVIFSIADCLRSFLSGRFEVFYTDGQLTCIRGPIEALRSRGVG